MKIYPCENGKEENYGITTMAMYLLRSETGKFYKTATGILFKKGKNP
jgi:hypothetical protein